MRSHIIIAEMMQFHIICTRYASEDLKDFYFGLRSEISVKCLQYNSKKWLGSTENLRKESSMENSNHPVEHGVCYKWEYKSQTNS